MATVLDGLAAGGGIAIAPVYRLGTPQLTVKAKYTANVNHEVSRLHDSFSFAAAELTKLRQRVRQQVGPRAAAGLDAQVAVAHNQDLINEITDAIQRYGLTAAWAVNDRLDHYRHLFKSPERGGEVQERALADLQERLVAHLTGEKQDRLAKLDHRAIIVAPELTPSQLARLNPRLVAGIVTDAGGRASHALLMTRELAIPTVVAVREATEVAEDEMVAIVDGTHGRVIFQPTAKQIDRYQQAAIRTNSHRRKLAGLRDQATISADGHRFRVAANLTLPGEAKRLAASGAEGVGLLRSEYLFFNRNQLPSEEEQFQAYKQLLLAVPHQRVVVRTLDVGGDKQLASLQLPEEPNPFLGLRGLRVSLAYPHLFTTQLRALLRASAYGELAIMFPLVSTVAEFRQAQRMVDAERVRLKKAGVQVNDQVEVGAMVEVPALVTMADQLARYADFFSIGTNDLVQYLFAVDRGNARVANLYQTLHPAVLRAVKTAIDAAHVEGKWVSLCGEMAAIPLAAPLLMGMGLDEFSVPPERILGLRATIHGLRVRKLQPLVHQALAASSGAQVKALVEKLAPPAG